MPFAAPSSRWSFEGRHVSPETTIVRLIASLSKENIGGRIGARNKACVRFAFPACGARFRALIECEKLFRRSRPKVENVSRAPSPTESCRDVFEHGGRYACNGVTA